MKPLPFTIHLMPLPEQVAETLGVPKPLPRFSSHNFIPWYPAFTFLMSRRRNLIVASGLVAFVSAGLAFPFYMASSSSKAKPVIDSSKPLPPQATFRGPYINTGSRDIGPDQQIYPKKQ